MSDIAYVRGFIATLTDALADEVKATEFIYLVPKGTEYNGVPLNEMHFVDAKTLLIPFLRSAAASLNPASTHPSSILNSMLLRVGGTMNFTKRENELELKVLIPEREDLTFKSTSHFSQKDGKIQLSRNALKYVTAHVKMLPIIRRVRTQEVFDFQASCSLRLKTEGVSWPVLEIKD